MSAKGAEYIQTIPSDILAAAVRGEINLNQLAKEELASRGLNWQGKWIGFERAAELAKAHPHRINGKLVAVTVPED